MSSTPRTAPPVCLVIRWPRRVAAADGPTQVLRRLVEAHLPATWAVESTEQTLILDAIRHQLMETALLMPKSEAVTVSDAIADGIHRFGTTGHDLSTLCVEAELPRGQVERQLAQLGVRTIVAESAASDSGAVRSLPFGLWQLAPQGRLPSRRHWFRRVGGVPQEVLTGAAGPAVVGLDVAALAVAGGRAWSELELTLDQVETANERGAIAIATVADLTAILARQSAPKPQRSILRAA